MMGEFFKLTFLDDIPAPEKKRPINRYNTAIRQLLKSGKSVALIKASGKSDARSIANGMRREIKLSDFPVSCIVRGSEVYIIRKGDNADGVSD